MMIGSDQFEINNKRTDIPKEILCQLDVKNLMTS